jgi:alpha-galactosidase
MKKLFFPAVAILLFVACNTGQTVRYTRSSPEIDAFKSAVEHYLDQNWDAYRLHYVDTAKFRNNVTKDKQISLDAAIEKWQEEHEMFASIHYVASEDFLEMVVTDEDETWVNFWGLWSAVLKANGQKFEIPVHVTARFENGKIIEEHGFWDSGPIVLVLRELEAKNE